MQHPTKRAGQLPLFITQAILCIIVLSLTAAAIADDRRQLKALANARDNEGNPFRYNIDPNGGIGYYPLT